MSRAGVVWGVALTAYVIAVMHRSSFGVSGLAAAERFSLPPNVLASFVFVQVSVYLAMQIPAGLLLDRWGSRALLVVGSFAMAAGQGLLAVATALPLVYMARVVVGAGDALIFVSTLALLPRWFPARRLPLLTQATATVGQLGQVLSAVPFLALLGAFGWSSAYGVLAGTGIVVGGLVWLVVRNAPSPRNPVVVSLTAREVRTAISDVWSRPGIRLAFFSHMGAHFSGMAFALMWGVPYLVQGQGRTSAEAGGLMTLFVLVTALLAPVMGALAGRHPWRRSWLVLTVIALTASVWAVVLLLPFPAPLWVLGVLVAVLAAGGPGAVVGMDLARTFSPSRRLGLAQSVVNVGGFLATLMVIQLVGWAMQRGGGYTFDAFRAAWLLQYPVWAIATIGVLTQHRKTRTLLAAQGIAPPRLRDFQG